MNMQDELNLLGPDIVHKFFQLALRAEEKLKRNQEQNNRGKGKNFRGRGGSSGRGQNSKNQGEGGHEDHQSDSNSRGNFRGRWPNKRGIFGGRGSGLMRCYNCNQIGHPTHRYPKKTTSNTQRDRRTQLFYDHDQSVNSPFKDLEPTKGAYWMMMRTLLKVPANQEPPQRKTIFRTNYKSYGKVCQLLINFGSKNNLVSLEMIKK